MNTFLLGLGASLVYGVTVATFIFLRGGLDEFQDFVAPDRLPTASVDEECRSSHTHHHSRSPAYRFPNKS